MKNGKIISLLRTAVLVITMVMTCSAEVNSNGVSNLALSNTEVKVEAVATIKKESKQLHTMTKKSSYPKKVRSGSFLGFTLYCPVDTTINVAFYSALADYKGPNVKINSMKRHHNKKSDHYSGNAVDFEFSHALIEYLISDDGKRWLDAHKLYFYIEGKPGSKKVAKYLNNESTRKFVFFNKSATGNHIHLGVA